MEGNVAGPWLAATGCVVPDGQEQKPSTKPWMKERYNGLGILRIALFFTFRVVGFFGLLCYGNWLVNICKPMEMPTVSSSHVKADAAVLSRPSGSADLIMREDPRMPLRGPALLRESKGNKAFFTNNIASWQSWARRRVFRYINTIKLLSPALPSTT
jgi:hypothetical protein